MEEVLSQYSILEDYKLPKPFGDGHINDTYLVESPRGKYILQRVNKNIFDTPVLVRNLSFLFEALNHYENRTGKKLTPAVFKNNSGKFHTPDHKGAAWRLMEFFPGCRSYAISPNENISYRGARAMGEFQLFLNTLPTEKFGQTIRNFHNTPARLKTFLKIVKEVPEKLKKLAAAEIQFAMEHQNIANALEQLLDTGSLPVRVTHNDTKLDNILFTNDGRVLIIDLDTIMPGSIIYDYGDMVRTFTSPVKEDEPDIHNHLFRIKHFLALTKGYLEPLKSTLTKAEKESLLLGAKAIIYEQALRFLTDFLQGNIYYKTTYREHNLIRTRTQIKLLKDMLIDENILQQTLLVTLKSADK